MVSETVFLIPNLDPFQSTPNPVVRVILPKHKSNHINLLPKTHIGLPISIIVKSKIYDLQGLSLLPSPPPRLTSLLTQFLPLYKHSNRVPTSRFLLLLLRLPKVLFPQRPA